MVADIAYYAMITAYPLVRKPQLPVTGITFLQSGISIRNHHSFSTRSVAIHLYPPVNPFGTIYHTPNINTNIVPGPFPHHIKKLFI